MIGRYHSFWLLVGFAVLTGVQSGCDSTPPVAETAPPLVSVSQPVVRDVIEYDDYEGRIAAIETVDVRSRVRGHLVKVNFEDGQTVQEGSVLYEIDPRPFKATLDGAVAQKAAAEAALKFARAEYARVDSLVSKGAATRQELDIWTAKQAIAEADVLKADAGIEEAKLDLNYATIPAPLTGRVSRSLVDVGNLVNAGGGESLLTTITSVGPMYVYFDVPERALLHYRERFRKRHTKGIADPVVALLVRGASTVGMMFSPTGQRSLLTAATLVPEYSPTVKDLKIPLTVALEGEEGYRHKGMIDYADNRVNPSTGTIQVRGLLPNTERILDAGMRARLRIPVSNPRKSLMVTERAIGTDQGRKFVYVVNDQNIVERRDVKLDRLSEGLQVIREGVKPEDRIVVNGIQRVRDGSKVEPKPITMPGAPVEDTKQKSKS